MVLPTGLLDPEANAVRYRARRQLGIPQMVTTEFEAKTPEQLAEELARADTIKLNYGGEVYQLTEREVDWIVQSLRGIKVSVGDFS